MDSTSSAARPVPLDDPRTAKRGMFVLEDGTNVLFTFGLLIFLFALWVLDRDDRFDPILCICRMLPLMINNRFIQVS
jgi:hypothetical protein